MHHNQAADQATKDACAGECSNAVAAMVALISPLPYSADFRPYFTIHDPAFAALAAGEIPSNTNGHPRLLGITNLYFLKVTSQPRSVLEEQEPLQTCCRPPSQLQCGLSPACRPRQLLQHRQVG